MENLQFEKIIQLDKIHSVILERLPRCSHIYNMLKMQESRFPEEMSFYGICGSDYEIDKERYCWILAKYIRDDNVQQYAVSIPNNIIEIPPEIEQCFLNTPSEILNWTQTYHFLGLDELCKNLVSRISTRFGNELQITPCQYYYMSREEAAQLKLSPFPPGFEQRSLNSAAGMQFFSFGSAAAEMNLRAPSRCVQRLPTVGAYVVESSLIASGARLSPMGHLGTATRPHYQRQGLSSSCFRQLIKILAKETEFIPSSMVDIENEPSIALHTKIGLHALYPCYCIKFKNLKSSVQKLK